MFEFSANAQLTIVFYAPLYIENEKQKNRQKPDEIHKAQTYKRMKQNLSRNYVEKKNKSFSVFSATSIEFRTMLYACVICTRFFILFCK